MEFTLCMNLFFLLIFFLDKFFLSFILDSFIIMFLEEIILSWNFGVTY